MVGGTLAVIPYQTKLQNPMKTPMKFPKDRQSELDKNPRLSLVKRRENTCLGSRNRVIINENHQGGWDV